VLRHAWELYSTAACTTKMRAQINVHLPRVTPFRSL
jgi:hypothetical protein